MSASTSGLVISMVMGVTSSCFIITVCHAPTQRASAGRASLILMRRKLPRSCSQKAKAVDALKRGAPLPLDIRDNEEGQGGFMWRDIRFGVRTLRRSPAFTVAAILT